MSAPCDPNEIVDLLGVVLPPKNSGDVPTKGKIATLTLREAERTVAKDWAGNSASQMSAIIVRQSGAPIQSLQEILGLHEKFEALPR